MPKKLGDIWLHFLCNTSKKTADSHSTCIYCKSVYKTNVTRMKKHLVLFCDVCPASVKQAFISEVDSSSMGASSSSKNDTQEDNSSSNKCPRPSPETPKRMKQSKMLVMQTSMDYMSSNEKEAIDMAFARTIYATAMPLNITRNSFWKDFFQKLRPSWKPPSADALSNELLNKWETVIDKQSAEMFQEAETLVIMCDSWTCTTNDSHVQFLIATPAPIFVKSVHPGVLRQTGDFIATEVIKICQNVEGNLFGISERRFSGCLTDHGSNMIAAWK